MLTLALVFGMSTAALAVPCNPTSVASNGIPSVAPGYTMAVMPKYTRGKALVVNGDNEQVTEGYNAYSVGSAFRFANLEVGFANAYCHDADDVLADYLHNDRAKAMAVGINYSPTPNTKVGVTVTNPGWFPNSFDEIGSSFAFTYSY